MTNQERINVLEYRKRRMYEECRWDVWQSSKDELQELLDSGNKAGLDEIEEWANGWPNGIPRSIQFERGKSRWLSSEFIILP